MICQSCGINSQGKTSCENCGAEALEWEAGKKEEALEIDVHNLQESIPTLDLWGIERRDKASNNQSTPSYSACSFSQRDSSARVEYSKTINNRRDLSLAMYATALGRWESDAYWVRGCISGDFLGPRQLLFSTLMGRTNKELKQIKNFLPFSSFSANLFVS